MVLTVHFFSLFFRRTEHNIFWATGSGGRGRGGGGAKKYIYFPQTDSSNHHDLPYLFQLALCRARFFLGSQQVFRGIYMSSLLVCRQWFPLHITYISFADMKYKKALPGGPCIVSLQKINAGTSSVRVNIPIWFTIYILKYITAIN